MVLVFDLDDTLYDEITYVRSGYRAVARWLKDNYSLQEESIYDEMVEMLEKNGRNNVFDKVLSRHNIFSKGLVKKCLSIYRMHSPEISLSRDALNCIERFKHDKKYIVTDGNKIVQANKIKALGLDTGEYFKKVFITYRYGLKNSKPSPYCFMKICELEKVSPQNVVYIGDNPNKDFVGLRPLGFKTVRVLQGMFKDLKKDENFEADIQIKSLNELTEEVIKSISK